MVNCELIEMNVVFSEEKFFMRCEYDCHYFKDKFYRDALFWPL